MTETLEYKCCIPDCIETPASVMVAKKENETLRFYACRPHEPAVWKYMLRKYIAQGYKMEIMNITLENR